MASEGAQREESIADIERRIAERRERLAADVVELKGRAQEASPKAVLARKKADARQAYTNLTGAAKQKVSEVTSGGSDDVDSDAASVEVSQQVHTERIAAVGAAVVVLLGLLVVWRRRSRRTRLDEWTGGRTSDLTDRARKARKQAKKRR